MRIFWILLCLFLTSEEVRAEEFYIQEITVEGLQRITRSKMLGVTQLQPSSFLTEQDIGGALKDIFATGFFDNVSIRYEENNLSIRVKERPSVEEIIIEGNKLIKTEQLLDALRLSGIKQGEIFPSNKFSVILNELHLLYAEQGRYGTQITADTEILEGNRVRLTINIMESDAAQVVQINIVGNDYFSDEELRKLMKTKTGRTSSRSKYSRQKFAADLDTLRNYYLNNGFARIIIKDGIVMINNAKNFIALSIHIEEGKRYLIDDIRIAGDTVLSPALLKELLPLQTGDVFSQSKIERASNAVTARLGVEGYGLAQVNNIFSYKEQEGKISLTLYIRPGQKTYVRRVEFIGNEKTTHTALRQYIVQMEGAPYSAEKIRTSLARLRRLSYIEDAQVNRKNIAGRPDQLDLLFTIQEVSSGSIGGGLIYNDVTGLSLSADYADRNFYGSGNSFSSSFSYSDTQQMLNFRFTQPYLTLEGLSASYFLRFTVTNFDTTQIGNYALERSSAGFSLGYPISSNGRINYGIEASNIHLEIGTNPATEIKLYSTRYGNDYSDFVLTSSNTYNNLNRGFKPTAGNDFSVSFNLGFPIDGRPSYYEIRLRENRYFKLHQNIDELSLQLGFNLAYLNSWDKDDFLPFYKHYYAGGLTTVRGYSGGSLGPRSSIEDNETGRQISSGSSLGGNLQTNARIEFIFPLPGISNDQTSLRSSFFWDIGNVFNTRCILREPHCEIPLEYDNLRQSVGFALRWYIQFFPIAFVWAYPLNPDEEDRTTRFLFTIGTVF